MCTPKSSQVPPPNCPTCDKVVYAAEEKLAGGYKWHKICFKCCNSHHTGCPNRFFKENLKFAKLDFLFCQKNLSN